MTISDRAQEILEKYWIDNKEEKKSWKMEVVYDDPIAAELIESAHALKEEHHLQLTDKGWAEAKSCVRRHRLAERLLVDVLDIKKELIHDVGCRFEHALQKSVEENICTLLGHPRNCPHGKPIPEGNCCRDSKRKPRKMVLPLSEYEVNEKGKIAFIRTDNVQVMNKFTAMGILPGSTIQLLRKTPSCLFQVGESQFAIDKVLAEKIQMWSSDQG